LPGIQSEDLGGQNYLIVMLELDKGVVRIPAGEKNFSILQNVEPNSEANPTTYSMGTGDLFQR
jgi:hypothetical protein